MRVEQIKDLPMATSAELYQLSWVIEQLMDDPRRIVREALSEPRPGSRPSTPRASASQAAAGGSAEKPVSARMGPALGAGFDPSRPTPFDTDAT